MPEKILLYNVKEPQDIIKAASNMRIALDLLMNPIHIRHWRSLLRR